MPSIYRERSVDIVYEDVDITVDEFLFECSDVEMKEVIKWLIKEDYIVEKQDISELLEEEEEKDCITYEFDNMVGKLSDLRLRMSLEDEETIREILKKY